MDIVLLANRLRLEERRLIEALAGAGFNAYLKTPEEITANGLIASEDGRAGLLISRLPAGAEAEAFANAFEAQGWHTLPSSDDLSLFSDRAQFVHAMQVLGLPLPRTLVASGHDAILKAAEALGYPVEVMPLDAAKPSFTADDADTAEALIEHRIALARERTMLVRVAHSADRVRRLLVIGEEVFASIPAEDGVDVAIDVTEADIELIERLFTGKDASAWAIDLSDDGSVLSIGPVERFRDLQRAGLDITGAFVRFIESQIGSPALT
ncbi:MAG: ATP-grasp domain-containing protein, partial [Chloroflexota bacterium]